jgi:hypothetical protein
MSIPAAVQRQADEAEAAWRRQYEISPEGAPSPTPIQEPTAVDTPVTPAAPAVVEPAAPVVDPNQASRTDWKQKFLVLKGKYDAEVPRYAQEVRGLKAELHAQTSKLLSLTEEIAKLRVTNPATNTQPDSEFDPALTQAIGRATADAVRTATKPLEDRLAVNEHEAAERRLNQFRSDVDDFVRDATGTTWSEIEAHPEFQAYMHSIEPAAGAARGILLNQAMQQNDAARVAFFYNDFFNRTRPSRAPVNAPAPVPATAPLVDPRAHLVTPAQTTTSGLVSTPPKRTYTQAEISRHYVEYARVGFPGMSSQERERLESQNRDIDLAVTEGRIRQ